MASVGVLLEVFTIVGNENDHKEKEKLIDDFAKQVDSIKKVMADIFELLQLQDTDEQP
jgi:hypothetical protein